MLIFLSGPLLASEAELVIEPEEAQVRVIALFVNAAMVDFDGKQKLYRSGQNITPQIKLIKADTRLATFLINGEEVELGLTQSRSLQFKESSKAITQQAEIQTSDKVARIVRDNNGMYKVAGTINGISVPFLVDTGATTVAMNEAYANLIGLPYKTEGQRSQAQTASGIVSTWRVTLNKVSVNGIELNHVEAVVIKGRFPQEILLGMSFLNRIKLEYDGSLLLLSKKF